MGVDDCFNADLFLAGGGVRAITGACFGFVGPITFTAFSEDQLEIRTADIQCCGCGWTQFWLTNPATGASAMVLDSFGCNPFGDPPCDTAAECGVRDSPKTVVHAPVGSFLGGGGQSLCGAEETPTPTSTPTVTPTATETSTPTPQLILEVDMEPGEVAPPRTGFIPSTTELKATVRNSMGTPVPGVGVNFEAVTATGGGHSHTAGRPTGTFSGPSCTTNPEGKCSAFYTATQFGGTETLSAYIPGQSVTIDQFLQVRVSGLVPLIGGSFVPTGETGTHPSNHFGRPSAMGDLIAAAGEIAAAPWNITGELLRVNDISLERGGRFDIVADWGGAHVSHRTGTDVDIENTALRNANDRFDKIMNKHRWFFIPEQNVNAYPHFRRR